MITSDKRLRTRPAESCPAITHKLKAVHLHGDIGARRAWEQFLGLTTPLGGRQRQAAIGGPWWLSLRRDRGVDVPYEPGVPESVGTFSFVIVVLPQSLAHSLDLARQLVELVDFLL